MNDILKTITQRHSERCAFDPKKQVQQEDLRMILEAARWTPTAHNMQNFEIILIDDKSTLDRIGKIKVKTPPEFVTENFEQLSFSIEEWKKKKVGIMGYGFPPKWQSKETLSGAIKELRPCPLSDDIDGSPAILIIAYDSRKRAPASKRDVFGVLSLGCLMENIWLMSESLGIACRIMSDFCDDEAGPDVQKVLKMPKYLKISYAMRFGYPLKKTKFMRVRRDIVDFVHHNSYGSNGFG